MTMRVYVGTYAKYNSGSIAGAWLDLEDYSDKEEFHAACKELHKDEADPEFMFQDWEGIPEGMVSESHIDEEVFELAALDDGELTMFTVYRSDVDRSGTIEQAREAYRGTYSSPADYAEDFYEETGGLEGMPEHLRSYIDWERVANDMRHDGVSFVRVDGGDVMVFIPD